MKNPDHSDPQNPQTHRHFSRGMRFGKFVDFPAHSTSYIHTEFSGRGRPDINLFLGRGPRDATDSPSLGLRPPRLRPLTYLNTGAEARKRRRLPGFLEKANTGN